jgi:preprotein translocase SecF subunit
MVFDFVKRRYIYISISLIAILIGIGFMVFHSVNGEGAFNYDVQFTGGTTISGPLGADFNTEDVKAVVTEATGDEKPQVNKVNSDEVAIKTVPLDDSQTSALISALAEKYGVDTKDLSAEKVSATMSKEMQKNAIISLVLACIAMLIYVSIRFRDLKIGASCIIALMCDAFAVLASYAIFRVPLDSSFIAAVLTVVGYSINASVVIFDRIRENKKRLGRNNFADLVNHSVSQTLRRSIFTSATVFFAVICLYIFGVQTVKEFTLPIATGVLAGAYSSIFISANVWYIFCDIDAKHNNKK